MPEPFQPTADYARSLDAADPIREARDAFHVPTVDGAAGGRPVRYFAGNSLGLQPKAARAAVEQELDDWARHGVDGHFDAAHPWYRYHEAFREGAAHLVGAHQDEVVMMNGLSANLHLLMATFYRPTPERHAILMDGPAFPSDTYVAQTQLRHHGYSPDTFDGDRGEGQRGGLIRVLPANGLEEPLAPGAVTEAIERHGDRIALVLLAGVNYVTGELHDIAGVVEAAHKRGIVVGVDLAHAVGNVPLQLHDWGVDFAAWCSYKYCNAGPGAVAGAFVHRRHTARTADLPILGGWWGNDPATRFRMHLNPTFAPLASADAWQLSNPPILALAPLRPSLALFQRYGIDALRQKSLRLTGYLEFLLDALAPAPASSPSDATPRFVEVITPRDPARRGCQLSLRVKPDAKAYRATLQSAGIVADFREPDIIRVAPVPLYNTFEDVHALATAISDNRFPR